MTETRQERIARLKAEHFAASRLCDTRQRELDRAEEQRKKTLDEWMAAEREPVRDEDEEASHE